MQYTPTFAERGFPSPRVAGRAGMALSRSHTWETAMGLKLEPGVTLVAATHNPGKAVELAALLDGRFQLVAAGTLGLPEPDETETTFVGNALLKARAAAEASGLIQPGPIPPP